MSRSIQISYVKRNELLVRQIENDLRAAMHQVELIDDTQSRAALYMALDEADVFLVCLSKPALISPYFRAGIYLARCRQKHVIPVILEECRPEKYEETEWLTSRHQIDFTKNYRAAMNILLRSVHPYEEVYTPGMKRTYIAYQEADADYVRLMAAGLRDAGINVWVDFLSLPGGADWRQARADAIVRADAMVVCLSTEAAQNDWVRRDLLLADSLGKLVIPVISERCMSQPGCVDTLYQLLETHPETRPLNRAGWIFPDQHTLPQLVAALKPAPQPASGAAPGITAGSQLGAYEVLSLIGRGAMGEVFKGRDKSLNRIVAIKTLPVDMADEEHYRARFEREARTVAGLRHPNIVNVFDFGQAHSTYYMVMEFIDGQDLGAYLRTTEGVSLAEALSILRDIASALDYAHEHGVIHRDVKPPNIMLRSVTSAGHEVNSKRAILTDFGITKITENKTRLTNSEILGTIDYIAPEQIMSDQPVDARADQYALAMVAYRMLAGRLPFIGSTGQLLMAHVRELPPDPRLFKPDLPESVNQAIQRALAKNPDHRFPTAGEFVAALEVKV